MSRLHTWVALAVFAPALASAAPQNEQVVSGQATFTRDGSLTVITTGTPQTIVNYTSFDIGRSEAVRIDQPDAASRILNNVLSTDPTRINGVLTSNGQVWISNPVGVFFGDQAIVDVGRLVAGAGTVDAGDFLAGVERWSDLAGSVEVSSGAQIRAADSVLLIGAAVANYGNIRSADGMIALVAGGQVKLARVDGRVIVSADTARAPDPERWAITQAGTLDAGRGGVSLVAGDAYSLAINHTGITRAHDIAIAGGDGGVVQVGGALDASDRSAGATGGSIAVTGERIALVGAQVDASGDAGGGEIRVGGDAHGEGALPTAQQTIVDGGSALRADAITAGDGGKVIVWADAATRFYGKVSARGGDTGGDGGFAEISGASLVSRGAVDLGASAGSTGTLLYDPKDIVLHAGTVDGTDADTLATVVSGSADGVVLFETPDEATTPFDVYESELENTNANIVLHATNSISSGDAIAVKLIDGNSLELLTRNNEGDATGSPFAPGIDLSTVSFQTGGTGSISIATGNDGAGGGGSATSGAALEVGALTTAGGAVSLATRTGSISAGTITTSNTTTAATEPGGAGGAVSLTTVDGSITAGAITANGAQGTIGGAGGTVGLVAGGTGSLGASTISAKGANGTTGAGGAGGEVGLRTVAGQLTAGSIDVSGGDGNAGGVGGRGGTISIAADIDPGANPPTEVGTNPYQITVNGALDATGGDNLSANPVDTIDDAGADGGGGGQVLVSAGLLANSGTVAITGSVDASAGSGTGGGGNAATGGASDFSGAAIDAIRIESHGDVTVNANLTANGGDTNVGPGFPGAAGGPGGNGGDIAIVSDRANTSYTGSLASQGGTGAGTTTLVDGTGGNAVVQGHGNVSASLGGATALDRFEVVETNSKSGAVSVTGAAGIAGSGSGALQPDGSGVHTVTSINTVDGAPRFTYRLADGGDGTVDQTDVGVLAVSGATFGANGGVLANSRAAAIQLEGEKLLGRVEGAGGGTHVSTRGNLQVFATQVGTTTPLTVNGTANAPSLELDVAGNLTANAIGTIGIVDVVQRSAAGDVAMTLPGGGVATIDGSATDDDGTGVKEATRITRIDTRPADTGFFFHLADESASSNETTTGEPVLTVASGAVTAGGNTGIAAAGKIALERGAIDGGGSAVVLVSDANRDGLGAIEDAQPTGTGLHVANAGALVAIAGAGVGTEAAPLHTSGFGGELALAGNGGSGDFRIQNAAGKIAVEKVPVTVANDGVVDAKLTYRGVYAAGAVDLDNGARGVDSEIELGAVQEATDETLDRFTAAPSFGVTGTTDGIDLRYGFGDLRVPIVALTTATADAPHVQSGGSQGYVGNVKLAQDAQLVAGGGVAFANDVDTVGVIARDLAVSAGGATRFGGNVGTTSALDQLKVTDAEFTELTNGAAGPHTVRVARADFQAIDGPGALVLRGIGAESRIDVRDNVGVKSALADFDVDADRIVLGTRRDASNGIQTSTDRIVVAGDVVLGHDRSASPSPVATIEDNHAGLSIESTGKVTMGRGEKLSSAAGLAIRAGDTATLADLSATQLSVDAPQIVIEGRAPGPVLQGSGALVTDRGVDWAANDITTSTVPTWDGVGTPPTFVLGDGGIRTGGAIPFDVVRFTPRLDPIEAHSFAGDDRTLDLTGIGPRVVSDARSDLPRDVAPSAAPALAAHRGDEPPSPPRVVSSDEVIGALRCGGGAADSCAPPAGRDDPLASERAREIVARYRALVASDAGQQSLRASFAPFAQSGATGAALPHALAADPALRDARERIGELAVTLANVDLLGLEPNESEAVRRAIAADFAHASGAASLDAEAVLTAVDASGVAVLPGVGVN